MDPASSALDAEAEQFAEQLADELGDTLEGQANARLVLVAAPHVLGSLRKHLDPKTAAKVSASLDRDYTWMDAHELIGALRQGLAPSA
jgi:protein required for attachment to host cells